MTIEATANVAEDLRNSRLVGDAEGWRFFIMSDLDVALSERYATRPDVVQPPCSAWPYICDDLRFFLWGGMAWATNYLSNPDLVAPYRIWIRLSENG